MPPALSADARWPLTRAAGKEAAAAPPAARRCGRRASDALLRRPPMLQLPFCTLINPLTVHACANNITPSPAAAAEELRQEPDAARGDAQADCRRHCRPRGRHPDGGRPRGHQRQCAPCRGSFRGAADRGRDTRGTRKHRRAGPGQAATAGARHLQRPAASALPSFPMPPLPTAL